MRYIDGFRNGDAGRYLADSINTIAKELKGKTIHVMEVCGSHTMSISRYGIRNVLPDNIKLLSGPGCPVCVTDTGYIDAAVELADRGIIVATFGDMIRVPGSKESLADARGRGGNIKVCYSPAMALDIAAQNPQEEVVFLAIGFETTMAPVTTLIPQAIQRKIKNISLLSAFKLVPPALDALIFDDDVNVDAFICPAHVSAIIGSEVYRPYVEQSGVSCVVCGFEPLDILYGIENIATQFVNNRIELVNQYSRVVRPHGNRAALKLFSDYLTPVDASWRGMGVIPKSGMRIAEKFKEYDAAIRFNISIKTGEVSKGCLCGDVLKAKIVPTQCPQFGKSCTPSNPVGPCMVSSEGSCAAYYKYERK